MPPLLQLVGSPLLACSPSVVASIHTHPSCRGPSTSHRPTLQPCRGFFSTSSTTATLRTVRFIEAETGLPSAPRTRYYNFVTLGSLRSFATRCDPEDATLPGFEQSVRAWGRDSG